MWGAPTFDAVQNDDMAATLLRLYNTVYSTVRAKNRTDKSMFLANSNPDVLFLVLSQN